MDYTNYVSHESETEIIFNFESMKKFRGFLRSKQHRRKWYTKQHENDTVTHVVVVYFFDEKETKEE